MVACYDSKLGDNMKITKIKDLIQIDGKGKEIIIRGVPTSASKNESGLEVPVIAIKDLEDGIINLDPQQKRTLKSSNVLEKSKIEEGDVLMATRGSALKAAVVGSEATAYIPSQNLIALRLNNTVLPEVFVAYLNSEHGQNALNKVSMKSTISSISLKDFIEIQIPVPTVEVQIGLKDLILYLKEYKALAQREQAIIDKINRSVISNFFGGI